MNANARNAADQHSIQALSELQAAPARSVEERWQASVEGADRTPTQPGEIGN